MKEYFIKTRRIGFSKWNKNDLDLAELLWGDPEVTRFICSSGCFSKEDIKERLLTEIRNDKEYRIQYWPIFTIDTSDLIGCCGIRPFKYEENYYELGFHLRKKYWGAGYASEAANAVIDYSFLTLKADKLYAGHHPENKASERILTKLGFSYIGRNLYEPTGLYHPSYELIK